MFWSLNNVFVYNLAYLFLPPEITCGGQECKLKDACENNIPFQIVEDSSITLHNWMEDMDAYCYSGFKIGLFGSLSFIGFTIVSFLMKLGDRLGRRNFMLYGGIIAIFTAILLIFIPYQGTRYTGMFIGGLLSYKLVLAYVFAIDFFPNRFTHIVAAA